MPSLSGMSLHTPPPSHTHRHIHSTQVNTHCHTCTSAQTFKPPNSRRPSLHMQHGLKHQYNNRKIQAKLSPSLPLSTLPLPSGPCRNRDGIGKGFFHLALVYESKPKPGYVLADVSRPFRSVAECISNYINMEWIEIPEFKPMCLKYPVIRRDCSGVRV